MIDATGMNAYLQTQYANQSRAAAAEATSKSISGISKESSKEEITKAVKDFETYMMEKVIKQMKETITMEEKSNDSMSMYKDLYLDSAINQIASQLVDDLGGNITDDFVEQIMRNYGITGTTNQAAESDGLNNDDVSENIANATGSTVKGIQT